MLHDHFETELRLIHLIAHFSKLPGLFSHDLNVLACLVAECAQEDDNFKFRHLVVLVYQEVHQFLIEVKESADKLCVAGIAHAEVAPLEDDVKNFHELSRLRIDASVDLLNTFDVLDELGILCEHEITELLSENLITLFL